MVNTVIIIIEKEHAVAYSVRLHVLIGLTALTPKGK
jgi:hypothetical protein